MGYSPSSGLISSSRAGGGGGLYITNCQQLDRTNNKFYRVCLKVLSNENREGGEWYQSMHFDKLSCRQACSYGTSLQRISTHFLHWWLMNFLNFEPASEGEVLIIIFEDAGRVNRVPGFISSHPNLLPPPPHPHARVPPPPPHHASVNYCTVTFLCSNPTLQKIYPQLYLRCEPNILNVPTGKAFCFFYTN